MNSTAPISKLELAAVRSASVVCAKDITFAVVFRGLAQFVFDLNHSAAAILLALKRSNSTSEIVPDCARALDVPEDVAQDFLRILMDDWQDAGAIGPPLQLFQPTANYPDRPDPDADCVFDDVVFVGGATCRLRVFDPDLYSVLRPLFATPDRDGLLPPDYRIDAWRSGDIWMSRDSAGTVQHYKDVQDARDAVLTHIIKASRAEILDPPVIHGATLRTPKGRYLMLSGDSGRGKTTLALGLAKTGFTMLSDDLSTFDARTNQVVPIMLNPSVKQGAWTVLSSLYPELTAQEPVDIKGRLCKYVYRKVDPADYGPHCIDALVFPNWQAGASASLTPFQNRESILSMLRWSHLTESQADLQAMADFLTSLPLYELTYSSFEDASSMLQDLLDG